MNTPKQEQKAGETPVKFRTTAAYLSGYITGTMWMPQCKGGIPATFDIKRETARFSDETRTTFRDVFLHILTENGGDFQDSRFTADTVLRVERIRIEGTMKHVHVFEREIGELTNCEDLVDAETYSGDFFNED